MPNIEAPKIAFKTIDKKRTIYTILFCFMNV